MTAPQRTPWGLWRAVVNPLDYLLSKAAFLLDVNNDTLPAGLVFTGDANRTYFGPDGVLRTAGVNEWPVEYDPVTLKRIGRGFWEARTNALLNSETPATQDVAVTAAARTISFFGTGTVTLSGAYSAVIVGTGAWPQRTTLTFTPGSGTLTVTPSGDVQRWQLETGSFVTPYIITAGSAVTRAAPSASLSGAAFSEVWNPAGGTLFTEASQPVLVGVNACALSVSDGSDTNRIAHGVGAAGAIALFGSPAGWAVGGAAAAPGINWRRVTSFDVSTLRSTVSGGASADMAHAADLAEMVEIRLGNAYSGASEPWCGHLRRAAYWPVQKTALQRANLCAAGPASADTSTTTNNNEGGPRPCCSAPAPPQQTPH